MRVRVKRVIATAKEEVIVKVSTILFFALSRMIVINIFSCCVFCYR